MPCGRKNETKKKRKGEGKGRKKPAREAHALREHTARFTQNESAPPSEQVRGETTRKKPETERAKWGEQLGSLALLSQS